MQCFPVISGLVILLGLSALPMSADDEPARIEGAVRSIEGAPVTNALVLVASARPRQAQILFCPSCAGECGKRARADADGRFRIEPIEPDLIYGLVVVAKGFQPVCLEVADPLFGDVQAELIPQHRVDAPADRYIHGKLIDPHGNPVVGATLEVDGATSSAGMSAGARLRVVTQPQTATDEGGRFTFVCTNGVRAISVGIAACGLCSRRLWLDAGQSYLLRLKRGATLVGRALQEETLLAGLPLVLSTEARGTGVGLTLVTWTDDQGQFTLPNVTPETRFVLHTRMGDMRQMGLTLPAQTVVSGADNTVLDLGDLKTQPAYRITGRLVLSDDQAVPRLTRLDLRIPDVRDQQSAPVGGDGGFEFLGVPPKSIELSLAIDGYRLSGKNPSRHPYIPGQLIGRVDRDLDDFVIHVEPRSGPREQEPAVGSGSEKSPLRGAKL